MIILSMTMMEIQQPLNSTPYTSPASQFVFFSRNIFITLPLQISTHSVREVKPALYVGTSIQTPSIIINIIIYQFFLHEIIQHLSNNERFTMSLHRPTMHWPLPPFATFLWMLFSALHPFQNISHRSKIMWHSFVFFWYLRKALSYALSTYEIT